VRTGTIGPAALDIAGLHKDLDVFTYDPGFGATAATESRITYIDGDAGVLLYRGYPIEQLAEKSSFMEVAYLLLLGELPTPKQLEEFTCNIRYHHCSTRRCCASSTASTTTRIPWRWCRRWWRRCRRSYHDTMDIHNPRHREIFSHRIIAKLPPSPPLRTSTPSDSRSSTRARLELRRQRAAHGVRRAVRALPARPIASEALDLLFHPARDHEQNGQHLDRAPRRQYRRQSLPAISAGVSALWGRHTGAPTRRCWRCSSRSAASTTSPSTWRWPRTSRATSGLMGFGHRVYKNFDPRAKIIREMCHKVLAAARACRQSAVRAGAAPGGDRAQGRVLRLAQALPERGFLFRGHLQRHRHSALDVHGHVCDRAHRGLGWRTGRR